VYAVDDFKKFNSLYLVLDNSSQIKRQSHQLHGDNHRTSATGVSSLPMLPFPQSAHPRKAPKEKGIVSSVFNVKFYGYFNNESQAILMAKGTIPTLA